MDDFEYEKRLAEEGARKKGFFKDLFWGLLVYSLFFGGIGFALIYAPINENPYWSIMPFSLAILINIVSIWQYIRYPGKKKSEET